MRAYSADLRSRVVGAVAAGMAKTEAARGFRVGRATVYRWVRRAADPGGLVPRPIPGRPARIGPAEEGALRAQLAAAPDATLAQHRATWERERGERVSAATMARAIRRVDWTLKKRP